MTDECKECCYKEWHNGDATKCNFLVNQQCIINERDYYESRQSKIKGNSNP